MLRYMNFLYFKMSLVMLLSTRPLAVLAVIFFLCSASFASANTLALSDPGSTSWMDEINWHGFINQNFVATDVNNYLGSSSDGSFKSNEAALNASWRATELLQFSVQALYKQIGNAKPKGTQLDYAIMDWRLVDDFSHGLGTRLGRLKNPYGFFNETRDVAVTNTSILLPESIYVDYLSRLFHSSDAIGFYGHREAEKGTFTLNFQYGRPLLNDQITSTLVGNPNTNGEISSERVGFFRLGYEDGAGLWRAALSYVHFDGDFKPAPSDPAYLMDGDLMIEQLLLSLELNLNRWQFVTEIQRRNVEVKNILSFAPDVIEKGLGYYFQIAYAFSPTWTFYARRDEVFRFKDDRQGKDFAFGADYSTFAKDATLGFRYSPSFEWSFAMEVHQIDGTYWLPNLENPNIAGQERYWNMFLAQVAYRF